MSLRTKKVVSGKPALLSIKRKVEKSLVVSWMRTKLSFALTRSTLICLRGSRMLKKCEYALDDIEIAENIGK